MNAFGWLIVGLISIVLAGCVVAPCILSGRISEQEEREEARRKTDK